MSRQARRVLVVANGHSEKLHDEIHDRVARTRAEVLVVSPARRAAEDRVCRCVEQLRLSGLDAEGVVGDADPLQAIGDALAVFEADVLVVGDPDLADRARHRFGLPTVHVDAVPAAA